MRILALRPHGLVLPFIHASMVRSFRCLGVEVREQPLPSGSGSKCFQHAKRRYDAVFLLDLGGNPAFPARVGELQRSMGIPWVLWFVDDPEGYGFPEVCAPEWTLAFCWDREIALASAAGAIPLCYLPLAADPALFFPESSRLLYAGGVFVGSTVHRNKFLEKAGAHPEVEEEAQALWDIYSRDFRRALHALAWRRLAGELRKPVAGIRKDEYCRLWVHACIHLVGIVKRQAAAKILRPGGMIFGDPAWRKIRGTPYGGRIAYGAALRQVYNRSAFVLDLRPGQRRSGLTQRILDAGACGRPILAEHSPELPILFAPGKDFFCFDNLAEACQQKQEILRFPEEAGKRAAKARKRILAEHTYTHRAAFILDRLRIF